MQTTHACRIVDAREELSYSLPNDEPTFRGSVGTLPADKQVEKGKHAMMKSTIQFMHEAIKNPKHPFRKTDSQPRKAQKNRYERRKVKEFLHLGDWSQEEMA
jgi:hypothetical protein